MTAETFDTLKLATAFAESTGEQIPTKADLKDTEMRLAASVNEAELRLEASLAKAKADTLPCMFGTIGFQTIVILGAVVALSRFGH